MVQPTKRTEDQVVKASKKQRKIPCSVGWGLGDGDGDGDDGDDGDDGGDGGGGGGSFVGLDFFGWDILIAL